MEAIFVLIFRPSISFSYLELLPANLAGEPLVAVRSPNVRPQTGVPLEGAFAMGTMVVLDVRVGGQMDLEAGLLGERLGADLAHERLRKR